MPDLLQNLFEFLPSLLFSFPDDLRGLNALSGELFLANTVFKTT